MKSVISAITTEGLKVRRSRVFLITLILSIFVPSIMAFMVFIAKNPDIAHKFGLLGAKATIINLKADWPTYFGLLNVAIAGIGLVMFGFITSWVFGREYADNTGKDLLALPVSRFIIVAAKFIVIIVWCILLSFIFILMGIFGGTMINLPGFTQGILFQHIAIFTGASILTLMLISPVAFFASFGRGYLMPIGFVLLALMVSQFIGALGFAPYFPWSIPILFSGGAGSDSASLSLISYIIIFFTFIFGLVITFKWWSRADQY